MLKTLFWNLKARQLGGHLGALCRDHDVDFVVIAEPPSDVVSLVTEVNVTQQHSTFVSTFSPSDRFALLTRLPVGNVSLVLDDDGILIREVETILGKKILLCAVHLPSKLHFSQSDQAAHATKIVKLVRDAEARLGNHNVLVVGDFNMNPFETGMIGAQAFNAVGDRRIAAKVVRRVQGSNYRYFYNPMWSFLGDLSSGPPGTHYFGSPGYTGIHWNMLDQVLLSPELLNMFVDEEVKILSTAGENSLMCRNGFRPKVSDHFPVLIGLR